MTPRRRRPVVAIGALALAAVYYAALGEWPSSDAGTSVPSAAPAERVAAEARRASGEEAIERAFRERRSDLWVSVGGVVEKSLSDDREGSRHQRFILRLPSGRTLLVAHNIDLAERVPLREGDRLQLRGEYEWNERGGVLHWTHHDPDGRRSGGWIEHEGQRYR